MEDLLLLYSTELILCKQPFPSLSACPWEIKWTEGDGALGACRCGRWDSPRRGLIDSCYFRQRKLGYGVRVKMADFDQGEKH